MGYLEKDVWKLMRGHNVWNTVVKPVEKRKLEAEIKNEIDKQKEAGENVDKTAAMNKLGIHTTIEEHLKHTFYEVFEEPVFIPDATRKKLNELFS